MKILSVAEAARRLGITPRRVRALIEAKRLRAKRHGKRAYAIEPRDLAAVADRPTGRPRKQA